MKKYIFIIVLLFGVLVPKGWSVNGFSLDAFHFVSVWGDIGYASLLNKSDMVKPWLGFSPSVGVGYRYVYKGFIVQVGIEGQYAYQTSRVDDWSTSLPMLDTEGDPFDLLLTMKKYRDVTQAVHLKLPVSVGYEYKKFYFMVGASAGMNVWTSAKASSKVDAKGQYADFIDPFEDMPNHQLQNNQDVKSSSYRVKWNNPSVNIHGEIGGRLDKFTSETGFDEYAHKYRIYLAAFFDYGLLNIHSNTSDYSIFRYYQNPGQPLSYEVMPMMMSKQMNNVAINPLVVGIKATVLLQLPGKSICVICKE